MTLLEMMMQARLCDTVDIGENWFQGRTAFGGFSAALALNGAYGVLAKANDEVGEKMNAGVYPVLRSAQVSFVGPVFGDVEITANILRQGRTAAFVEVTLNTVKGVGLKVVFVFMSGTGNTLEFSDLPAPKTLPPESAPADFKDTPKKHFINNFDISHANKKTDDTKPEFRRWIRLKERQGLDIMSEIMLVADALPPAALKARSGGPISSVTWIVNLLSASPSTENGYWLGESVSDYAHNGCSSQKMKIWAADGTPIVTGLQSVALF